jgi:hypothetical protein
MAKKIYDPYLKFGLNNNPDAKADLVDFKVPPDQSQVSSVSGKKGAVVLSKSDVGLNNVDNTSDANKPVSVAAQAVIISDERVLAEVINQLNSRISALELFLQNSIFNDIQAESLSAVKSLQFKGSELIKFGAGAPSFAPDFVGQIYVKTDSTTAVYVATGISTAADFKAV